MYKRFLKILMVMISVVNIDLVLALGNVDDKFMTIINRDASSLNDLKIHLEAVQADCPEARLFLLKYCTASSDNINVENFDKNVIERVRQAARYLGGIWYKIAQDNPVDINSLEIVQRFLGDRSDFLFFDSDSELNNDYSIRAAVKYKLNIRKKAQESGQALSSWGAELSRLLTNDCK